MANQKDLFHSQGNATVGMPKVAKGKKKTTDPYTSPGNLIKTKKVVKPGWSK